MLVGDKATKALGGVIEKIGPGHCEMSMIVEDWHLNGHNICHGGYIYTLADSCFAFACNSFNQKYVSQHGEITYIAPAYARRQVDRYWPCYLTKWPKRDL